MQVFAAALAATLSASPAPAPAPASAALFRPAAEFLPAAAFQAPRFKIDPAAPINGVLATFTLHSDWGVVKARGRELALVRVGEMAGVEKAEAVSKTDAFAAAAKNAALKPVKAVGNLVQDPGGTAEGAAKGVVSFFNRTARKAKKGAQSAQDAASKDEDEKEDAAAPGTSPAPAASGGKSGTDKVKDVAEEAAGINKARRQWAQKFGVDPYTTNPLLADRLHDLAQASFAGGLATSIAIPGVPGVGVVTKVSDLAWSLPPADIEARNEKKLKAMGIEGRVVRDYFRNPWFTPTLDLELVDALEVLDGASGREAVLRHATEAASEEQARLVRSAVRMLAEHHRKVEPIVEATAFDVAVYGRTRKGEVVLPAPVDYVEWRPGVQDALSDPALAAARRSVWVTGKVSARAAKEIAAMGWTLHAEVPWPEPPPPRPPAADSPPR